MRPINRRKANGEERRAAILKAARSVFAQSGFAHTVMDDVAEQAGLAKGTLYLYFRSKEELYMAVLMEDASQLHEQTRERMEQVQTWDEKLRAFLEVRFEYLEAHTDFLRIYFSEVRALMLRGATMQADLFRMVRSSEEQLAYMFAAASAKNEIRSVDPELVASTVLDMTHGLVERRLMGWTRTGDHAATEFLVDVLCRALAPEAAQIDSLPSNAAGSFSQA